MPEPKAPPANSPVATQGYTLSGLFLLTATCAVGAQLWRLMLEPEEQAWETAQWLLLAFGLTIGSGLLLGAFLGVWLRPRRRNAALGGAVGMAVSAFFGPLIRASDTARLNMTISLCVGAFILLALAAILHSVSPRRAERELCDLEKLFGAAGARQAVGNQAANSASETSAMWEKTPENAP